MIILHVWIKRIIMHVHAVGLRGSYPGKAGKSVLFLVPNGTYSVITLRSYLTEDGFEDFLS